MKLYRSHSEEFEKVIEKSKKFVIDKTRRYNNVNEVKNQGNLFFYGTDKKSIENYQCEDYKIYEYEFDGNLLDTRDEKNRAKLVRVVELLRSKDENDKRKEINEEGIDYFNKYNEGINAETSAKEVIENKKLYSCGYMGAWGQKCTDYELGKIMREELTELGYDGIIYECGKHVDVALLKSAKKSNLSK